MAPPLIFPIKKHFHLFLSFLFTLATGTTSITSVGISYSPPLPSFYPALDHHPPPPTSQKIAAALQRLKISAVRLHPESTPSAIRAFSSSNISLLLTIPNPLLPAIAANRSNAAAWLYGHVVPFYPRARISLISVGSDVLNARYDLSAYLLPAVRNIHVALHALGIHWIAVSTTFSFINILTTAFPPSAAKFQEPADELIVKPLLQFLKDTNSSILVNLHPYYVYQLNPKIPIGFALFQEHPYGFRVDLATGLRYRNLYDMMVDALITAMDVAGYENIPVVVAETGWPCSGAVSQEDDANQVYAEMYIKGLVDHLRSGVGTPLRKQGAVQVYVYELFDKVQGVKQGIFGPGNWGILYPNLTSKYDIDFGGVVRIGPDAIWFIFLSMGSVVCTSVHLLLGF